MCCDAQNIKQDMMAMYHSYMNLKYFSTTIKVDVYKKMGDTSPYLSKKGQVKKSGNFYFTSLDDIKLMVNAKYLIYVSGKDKLIYYQEHGKNTKQEFAPPFDINEITAMIDSAVKRSDSIQYMGTVNNMKHYSIRSSRALINAMDLYIDARTSLISKVVYYYNATVMETNNKVTVSFDNVVYDKPFAESEFSESQFLKGSGNSFVAADKYTGYEVYNDKSFDNDLE
jgi:hypothetical protein